MLSTPGRAASATATASWSTRPKARELAADVTRLRSDAATLAGQIARLTQERHTASADIARLTSEIDRLGILPIVEVERRISALAAQEQADITRLAHDRQQHAADLQRIAREHDEARQQVQAEHTAQLADLQRHLRELSAQIVVSAEAALLQEAGIYQYRHPLSDAIAYQAQIARLQDQIKTMIKKDGGAVQATTNWTVNNSAADGRAMVRDFSKLMLRAYNAEADNLVRGLKPYKLDSAIDRLSKVATTIARLGKTMHIKISPEYHQLRVKELELTADYQEKLAQEKEREREDKIRLREERQVQQEIERERARLDKERQHYANALSALLAKGDESGARRLQEELTRIEGAIQDVDYRAANVRAGYIYVISNIGAFGERMVKIGMTRRLQPLDRIRELSDASVPFNFDVHAIFFSDDAVGIESAMHSRFASRRVNLVNQRREFFYATPNEAKQHLLDQSGPDASECENDRRGTRQCTAGATARSH